MKTYPLYLNGDFVPTDETVNVVNPATGETFARMSIVDRARVAKAVRDAHDAFQSWRKVSGKGRGELLQRIANQLEHRREEIARVITQENGKPLSQSLGEVAFAVDHLRWFAEEARRISNRIMPHQVDSKRHMILKTPMGAVAAISPWNFPLMLAVRKVAAALPPAARCF